MRGTVDRIRTARSDRGSVLVMVGVWLPVLALFVSLAVDFGHFFDYSRNLQNRADAAALAAGSQFGGTCFGTPSPGALDNIGETAQQYSGPLAGADVPYTGAQMAGRTSYNLPNLSAGVGGKLHVLLNSTQTWDNGGADWTMGSPATTGSDASFCDGGTENGVALGPTADVKITQDHLPLFFPLLGFQPNISATARVQIQGSSSPSGVRPIAVPDPGQTPCLRAVVVDDTTGNPILDSTGNPVNVAMTPPSTTTPFWTVQLPAITVPGKQLSVQAYIPDDCNNPAYPAGGTLYDSALQGSGNNQTTVSTNGIVFINTYQNYNPATINGATVGSVWLTPAGCTDPTESGLQDAYFYYFPKSTTCSVTVHTQADFKTGVTGTFSVSMDGGTAQQMVADNPATDAGNHHIWKSTFAIPTQSGRHTFVISWSTGNGAQNNGTFNGGNPLQSTFAALSDQSDPPDDSGPVTQAEIGDNTGNIAGVDTILQGSTQTLTVAFRLQGLELAQPGDPPIILRAAVQNSKKTGVIDCGEGNAASGVSDAIINGCPDAVSIYQQSQGCVVLPATPLTCADLVPGNKRVKVFSAFQSRIQSINSPCDNWQAYKNAGTSISGFEPGTTTPDPRIFIMVVTSPGDLSGNVNTGPLKILGFATFYVTGWDNDPYIPDSRGRFTAIPGCDAGTHSDQDEPYPGTGSSNNQIWGHFIKYVAAGGTPNGNPCNPTDPSVCVPALTR